MRIGLGLGVTAGFGALPGPTALFTKYGATGLYIPNMTLGRNTASGLKQLYTVSTGITPVTAIADPIGLLLDESQGAAIGAELLLNGGFSADTDWVDIDQGTGTSVIAGGVLTLTGTDAANRGRRSQAITCVVGRWYKFSLTADNTLGVLIAGASQGSETFAVATVAGLSTLYFQASGTTMHVGVRKASSAGTAVVDNASCVEVAGQHLSQATAASRGTLRQVGSRYVWRGDGIAHNLLGSLTPTAAMTMLVAVEFNAVSDCVVGANDGSSNRAAIVTHTDGRLGGRVGAHTETQIIGGADVRDIPGVAALRFTGALVSLFWKPFSGAIAKIYESAQSGSPPTTIPVRLGALNGNGTASTFLDGDIYGAFLIRAALSDAEIGVLAAGFSL